MARPQSRQLIALYDKVDSLKAAGVSTADACESAGVKLATYYQYKRLNKAKEVYNTGLAERLRKEEALSNSERNLHIAVNGTSVGTGLALKETNDYLELTEPIWYLGALFVPNITYPLTQIKGILRYAQRQ
jgi:hypothetical protein